MRRTGPLLVAGASIAIAASEPARPRGVGPEFSKFYKDPSTFTCISNPSIQIPVTLVNDDVCDCPDGSDEPGTAACSYLSPLSPSTPSDYINQDNINATIALPGFYCKNKGHTPLYVPFTNVNDGVCDYEQCCDGSDEWAGVGGVKCEDRCAEIGKEARSKVELRQKALSAAGRRRKELVAEAGRLRKQVEDQISNLNTKIEADEVKVAALEKELAEIERSERGKVVKSASAKAGKLGVLVGLARHRTQELREHLTRVAKERDTARGRIKELETILNTFKTEYNPNFNDEGVKRAVRSYEDYIAVDRSGDMDAAHNRDLEEITKTDEENGIKWEDYTEEEGQPELELLYDFEAYLPLNLRTWLDSKLRSLRLTLIDNGILAESSDSSSTETKPVTDARNRLNSARDDLSGTKTSLTTHTEDLGKDYGPDDVFRALKGQCISTDSGEYTYEMCFMDKTTQKSKKGGGHTGMGNFVRFDRITVDEELPADGRGVGSGERIVMRFENGQHCWNGPNRSTMVVLACAEKDEVWSVKEEEKCVYRMEVGSAAVCEVMTAKAEKAAAGIRDEL